MIYLFMIDIAGKKILDKIMKLNVLSYGRIIMASFHIMSTTEVASQRHRLGPLGACFLI